MKIHATLSDLAGGLARTFHSFLGTSEFQPDGGSDTPAVLSLDPICGEWVQTGRRALSSTFHGRTFFFCSEMCKLTFDCDPRES